MAEILTAESAGGKKIRVSTGKHTVQTDQSKEEGGDDTAPTPLTLFLASLAACAAHYANGFCEAREISTAGLRVALSGDFNAEKKRWDRLRISLHLPEGFPAKYKKPILRVVDMCTVKKHVLEPPVFESEALEND
jgi:ribosomal protein S12 methylthiotransferase accessory factor